MDMNTVEIAREVFVQAVDTATKTLHESAAWIALQQAKADLEKFDQVFDSDGEGGEVSEESETPKPSGVRASRGGAHRGGDNLANRIATLMGSQAEFSALDVRAKLSLTPSMTHYVSTILNSDKKFQKVRHGKFRVVSTESGVEVQTQGGSSAPTDVGSGTVRVGPDHEANPL